MANTPINISSLDFDGVKASLKSYLSSKPEFSEYDFSGSTLNLLLDVLAYNTMFYGYYTNMIANETFLDTAQIENNVVRLASMLGVSVPSKSCATSQIIADSLTPSSPFKVLSYSTTFTGNNISGSAYKFYTISDVNVSSNTEFTVYEANSIVKDLTITVDLNKQTAFLGTIDPVTVSVKVNGTIWTRYDGSQIPNSDSQIFYVERIVDGFQLVFGKRNASSYSTSEGKTINESDIVQVSYLVSSGTVANSITSIKNANITIKSSTSTSGGTDSPNLDAIRYSAPKSFAANQRAVTQEDYYSFLLSSNLLPSSITQREQLNIWGGDAATPPAYGRIFVSFANTGITAGSLQVKNSIAFLKAKSIIGTLPEYVQAQPITANITLDVVTTNSTSVTGLAGILQNYYNNPKIFNNDIRIADIKTVADANFTNIKSIGINSLNFVLGVCGSDGQKLVNFKNELRPGSTAAYGNALTTTGLSYSNQTIYLADMPITFDSTGTATEGKLVSVDGSLSLIGGFGYLGYVNYSSGYAVINENVLAKNASINMTAHPRYPDSTTIKDEFLLTASFNTNITQSS
jgi:hypothetical protein